MTDPFLIHNPSHHPEPKLFKGLLSRESNVVYWGALDPLYLDNMRVGQIEDPWLPWETVKQRDRPTRNPGYSPNSYSAPTEAEFARLGAVREGPPHST